MTVGTIEMSSEALGQKITYTILLPDQPAGPLNVLMQLHGRGGHHRDWLYHTTILNYLEKLPLAVVLPDGADHMWSNMYPAIPYEPYLVDELRNHVEASFPVKKGVAWAIGGNSMGGYGALRLGLKYPTKFCSVYAHSSPVHTQEQMQSWPNNFTQEIMDDLDLTFLADHINRTTLPRLSFDCGTEDEAVEDSRRFHTYLEEKGLPHQYREHPGVHDWRYWESRLPEALRQHAVVFNLPFSV